MISVAVRIETECGTCRMPMPINTLAREVGCPSCGRPTEVSDDVWQALLRDPVYDGPRMLANEGRQCSARKLSAAYTRRGPCCQGCEKEIPVASIVEVREQAMLQCDRCAKQTWVRAVPVELAGALPDITHLVGEDPDSPAMAQANAAEAATFPCPQCGSPVAFDGVNRAYTCRFCSANVHVPDDFVYRGRRKVAADWFLIFHPSIADSAPAPQAVAAGLFDWEEPPVAAVDAEGNLYCAARQTHWVPGEGNSPRESPDNVLWSIDPSLNVRWLHRNRRAAVHLALSPRGALLVTSRGKSSMPWLSSSTGSPIEEAGGTETKIDGELLDCEDLVCDRDGSLLILKEDIVRRISPSGVGMPVRPGGTAQGVSPVELQAGLKRIHPGPGGAIDCMYMNRFVRVDVDGRVLHEFDLSSSESDFRYRTIGVDVAGNSYLLCREQVVRVSAAGEPSVVLESKRDDLPRAEMSIAVCPDGSYWLFGTKGRAWRFDRDGELLFASEKESRPKKLTRQQVFERQMDAVKAKIQAKNEESDRLMRERRAEAARVERIIGIIAAIVVLGLLALLMVAAAMS
ncbi:hypothetical protein WMF45_14960 [Sorangium sp. So ce448]|uniref:hypothetical protein n=1 Tax=Sorangium sp. So ce448 TaxID=3133314 RepID=UPI003F5F2CE7